MKARAIILAALLAATPAWAAKKKKVRHPAPAAHIACTIYGCHPTPPGCYPQMGYTPDGYPTGFDIVVCPRSR